MQPSLVQPGLTIVGRISLGEIGFEISCVQLCHWYCRGRLLKQSVNLGSLARLKGQVMPAWDSGNSIDSIAVQEVSAAREEEHTSTPFLSLGADERHRNFEDLNKPSQFLT